MFSGPTGAYSREEGPCLPQRKSLLSIVVTKCDRLRGKILHHSKANIVFKLIHATKVVGGLSRSSTFEHDHRSGGPGTKFLGQKKAGPPPADNYNVCTGQSFHSSFSRGWPPKPTGSGRNATPKCLSTSSY